MIIDHIKRFEELVKLKDYGMPFIYNKKETEIKPEDRTFHLVEDKLPESEDPVEVIYRNHYYPECHIGTGRFNPTIGWNNQSHFVFAWRPFSEEIKQLFDKYKRKDS